MKVDERVLQRLNDAVQAGASLKTNTDNPFLFPMVPTPATLANAQAATSWFASTMELLRSVFGDGSTYALGVSSLQALVTQGTTSAIRKALGYVHAARDDYAGGHIIKLRRLIEAEVFDDFLEQAEHLLANGYFQAAAVVVGCVLEVAMRKICAKHSIQLPDKPKLDWMNSELAKKGAYSKLVQKEVTAKSDIRNSAAHGQWDQFTREDVDGMLAWVRRFVSEHSS